jgi:hypothetical protein
MKVAGLAVCAAAVRRHKLTDEQVPLSLSTSALALPLEQGTIGLFRSVPEQMEQVEHLINSLRYKEYIPRSYKK